MEEHKVSLSNNQVLKVRRGHPVQLSNRALKGEGERLVSLALNSMNAKKVAKAVRLGKGCRLQLSAEEIESSGSGLKEMLEKGFKKAKTFTQSHKKEIRAGLTKALKEGAKFLPIPGATLIADKFADDLVNYVGDKTKAFGVKGSKKVRTTADLPSAFTGTYNNLLNIQHPSMKQVFLLPDPSEGYVIAHKSMLRKGSGFKAAGAGFMSA